MLTKNTPDISGSKNSHQYHMIIVTWLISLVLKDKIQYFDSLPSWDSRLTIFFYWLSFFISATFMITVVLVLIMIDIIFPKIFYCGSKGSWLFSEEVTAKIYNLSQQCRRANMAILLQQLVYLYISFVKIYSVQRISKHLKGHLAPRVSNVTFLDQRIIPGSLWVT